MTKPFTLFEISWEVCNKVGGIHTVLSTKARTQVAHYGDEYVAVGPEVLSESGHESEFEEDPSFAPFCESCRDMGIPVRVGRWLIPGRPRTILIDFSTLYHDKDDVLSALWEDYGVDSLEGAWDYVEPVLFGHAAGRVIERWWEEYLVPRHRRAVVHAHEWMTGSSLLYLKRLVPSMGTVFTTHATMLGRALSSLGHSPEDGLGDETPESLAREHGVVSKHSLEGVCAREADAFTTVSEITAKEAELLHGRAPSPVLPNGIDLSVIDELAGDTDRVQARAHMSEIASKFLGEDVSDAVFLCVSGRYEYHNKGLDVLLDALAGLQETKGRRVVTFVLVPAGNSGVRSELVERLDQPLSDIDGALGISTHNLFDEEQDPVVQHCARVGLANSPDTRVRVIQIPIYLPGNDGLVNLPYQAVLRAMDLTCFPSYYEPWGYTPQESLAVGVPTITSDYAGFGRWAQKLQLDDKAGITVLQRVHVEYDGVVEELIRVLGQRLESVGDGAFEQTCRATAALTEWSHFITHYDTAYSSAIDAVQLRLERGVVQSRRPKLPLAPRPTPEGQSPRLLPFDVAATLPPELRSLERLARNYWWCWDPEARSVFAELSPRSWEACEHNPVAFLQRVYPEDLAAKAADAGFISRLEGLVERMDAYLAEPPSEGRWRVAGTARGADEPSLSVEHPVAYFCAEFGLHESLRIYSGGLGVLAGDHLKSASDLNLPFVAVGLFYRHGYLTQRLNTHGEQISLDVENDPRSLPIERVRDERGQPLTLKLGLPGRQLLLGAWRVAVGRISLYLLDANCPENRPEDRDITRNLYGGEAETRLQQEIVLGRGGVRLLELLGIQPAVFHMNEGHAAFLTLERVRGLVGNEGLTFDEARECVRETTLFTTHTPVPAGHDRFGEDLLRRYFSDVHEWLGVPWERFRAFGQAEEGQDFNMTYLALNFAAYCNGVSKLHGEASRGLLHPHWPGLIESEVPVRSITNGIHLPTWTDPAISRALGAKDRPIRPEDFTSQATPEVAEEVWRRKQEIKGRLLEDVRGSLRRSFLERGESPLILERMTDGLRDEALYIGFARRFAPYKRAHLIFQDHERLRQLLSDESRPLRLLIAGKAHPRDEHGKDILRSIVELSRTDDLIGKVFFIENYDMNLARLLVAGVDVWLNNPTRMLEASGTSGMKASANGGLNLSIGDGWWPEGYDGNNGWLIAEERSYKDQELQDEFDSSVLYRLLEEEVLPDFFDRDGTGSPTRWVERVRANLASVPPMFNTDRMVTDYLREAYAPLGYNRDMWTRERRKELRERVADANRIRKGFSEISIISAQVSDLSDVEVGNAVVVRIEVELGSLDSSDIVVELVLGHTRAGGDLRHSKSIELHEVGESSPRAFEGEYRVERSGSYAYGIRVRARSGGALQGLVLWA